jgi:hypothetical protein
MPTGSKTKKPAAPSHSIVETAAAWLVSKREKRRFEDVEKELNKKLSAAVEAEGSTDEKGHVWFRLPDVITGWDKDGKEERFNALQRQRRVSVVLDGDAAIEILERHDLVEECSRSYLEVTDTERAIEVLEAAGLLAPGSGIEVRTVPDEDAIRGAFFEDKITQEEFDRIFTSKVTWALLPGRL